MLSREAANTKFLAFGLTRLRLKPTNYHTLGKHTRLRLKPTNYHTLGKHTRLRLKPTNYHTLGNICFYYMTSDNVFSDWLTSLVTFFDETLYSMHNKSREVNITFQRFSRHLKIEMVFPNYLKGSSQSSSG